MNACFVSTSGGNYEINALILNITTVFTDKLIKHDVETNQIDWKLSVTNYFLKRKMILVTNLYPSEGKESEICILTNGNMFYSLKAVINRVRLGVIHLLADKKDIKTKKKFTDAIPKWFTEDCNDPVEHTPAKSLINDILFRTTNIKNTITTKFHIVPSVTVEGKDKVYPYISYKDEEGTVIEQFSDVVTKEFVHSAEEALTTDMPVEVRVIPEKKRRGRPVEEVVIDFDMEDM